MHAWVRLANERPDGPSWSPYLAVCMFLVAAIVMGALFVRSRRRSR
ncbi:hypothetical protein OG802_28550 [Streptomyces sp. NBC_00704]|nr:hypothetical protein [Streptomyces sp. NBC_00704]